MALLKMWRTIRQQGVRAAWRKIAVVAPEYLRGIASWRCRRCRCCERWSIFVAHRNGSAEFRACLFCSANERYELLATEIRERYWKNLPDMDVLELDPKSPLRTLLSRARSYTRTFYEEGASLGQKDGAFCEDITDLKFKDWSLDLIVSSDVLEHVPDLQKALSETARVLRPNGAHLFTVPPRGNTRKRAEILDGRLVHIEPPDFHLDPLSALGILAFWDVGPDLADVLPTKGLDIRIVRGPTDNSGRVVWLAAKSAELVPHLRGLSSAEGA